MGDMGERELDSGTCAGGAGGAGGAACNGARSTAWGESGEALREQRSFSVSVSSIVVGVDATVVRRFRFSMQNYCNNIRKNAVGPAFSSSQRLVP